MSEVLTAASTVTCLHLGKVSADSSSRLRVATQPVLLADITGKSIDCPVTDVPNQSIVHCSAVLSASLGQKSKLRVGKVSVLLSDLAGLSNGTPPPLPAGIKLAPALANQTRLRAAAAVA